MKVKLILPVIFFSFSVRAQYIGNLQGVNLVSSREIPHASEWSTGIFTAGNVFIIGLNVVQFKKTERRSNAGFLLFPGIFQIAMGGLFKDKNDPTRNLDVAIGAVSVLSTAARMLYFPKTRTEKISFAPYILPSKKSIASGFSLSWKL